MSPGLRRGFIFIKIVKFLFYAQKSIVYFTFAVSVILPPPGNSAAMSLCLDFSAQEEFACVFLALHVCIWKLLWEAVL